MLAGAYRIRRKGARFRAKGPGYANAKGHCELRTQGQEVRPAYSVRCVWRSVIDETREESWVQTLKGPVCCYRQQGAVGVYSVASSLWKLGGG